MRVAVVGAGVSGLVAAHRLAPAHDVTLFEAGERAGGHTNTVEVEVGGVRTPVDTGFIVYNERNYPRFTRLLAELGVATQPSEMSFSVSSAPGGFEYRGNGLGLWAQRSSLLDPSHARLLADILRFNARARAFLASGSRPSPWHTLADFLAEGGFGPRLARDYVIPLGAAIWSADPTTFAEIPAATVLGFLDNHGMLQLKGRPRWRTVSGGARRYVEAITDRLGGSVRTGRPVKGISREPDGVTIWSAGEVESFDAVVVATHSDDALELLADPSREEAAILGAIGYRANDTTLHTDRRMLPARERAWASWNAHLPAAPTDRPTVTYLMNRLQGLDLPEPLCVTLNRDDEIDPARVLGRWTYRHPVFSPAAVAAQRRRDELQGARRTWYCGAYWGYGFHEDGVASAVEVCRDLGVDG